MGLGIGLGRGANLLSAMTPLESSPPLSQLPFKSFIFLMTVLTLGWHCGSRSNSSRLNLSQEDWQTASDGEGTVVFDREGILLTPKTSMVPEESHASLLLSEKSLRQPLRNFRLDVTLTNVAQLRAGTPNPWEVFWIFFNYTLDVQGKKKANYAMIKPNGVEIGKAFDEVGQDILFTQNSPTLSIGVPYTLTILKKDSRVTVLLNDSLAADYENPRFYDVPGAIGLYSEDAQARIHKVILNRLP